MNNKNFWIIQKRIRSCIFHLKKCAYTIYEKCIIWSSSAKIQLHVLKTMLYRVIFSIVLALILKYIDGLLLKNFNAQPILPDMFRDITIGGMGIAGVILGLYCANIASIFSAKYTNVPRSLAKLFQQDIVTNRCIKQIVSFIVFCTILLLECALEYDMFLASMIGLLLLTIRVVVTFSMAGNRSYALSDTFSIADIKFADIYETFNNASKINLFSTDKNFQNHYRKMAHNDIMILADIGKYNLSIPKNQNGAMLSFVERILTIIDLYWRKKADIPFDSLWFGTKTHYRQWHLASDAELSIALNTGTAIRPEDLINSNWFEDELLKTNQICIEKFLKDDDILMIQRYLTKLLDISQAAGKSNQADYWLRNLERIAKQVNPIIYKHLSSDDIDLEISLSAVDALCSNYTCVVIGINHYLTTLDLKNIFSSCISYPNKHQNNPNKQFFNTDAYKKLSSQISAEMSIEKEKITPDWYIEQIVANEIYTTLGSIIDSIFVALTNVFDIGQQFLTSKHNYAAATALSHVFNLLEKCDIAIGRINNLLPELKAMHIEKNIVWEEVTTNQVIDQIKQIKKQLPNMLIQCSCTYAIEHWKVRGDSPDFLGLCYNHITESLIRAIESDDFIQFQEIYKDYFNLVLLYFEYIRTDVIKHTEKHMAGIVLHVATAPFLEYALVSGLAIIWGEFLGEPKWKELIDNSLSSFLDNSPNGKAIVLSMAQFLQNRQHNLAGIGNRDILQTGWVQRIEHSIYQNPAFEIVCDRFHKKIKTDSKLLASFSGFYLFDGFPSLHNPEDVYMIATVNKYLPENQKYKSISGWERNYAE